MKELSLEAGVHTLIGIGEGLITVGALAFLRSTRKDLVGVGVERPAGKAVWVAGLVIAAVLAIASPLASANPDGLERVAEDTGFLDKGLAAPYQIIPDYVFPGISNEAAATVVAGVVGVIIVASVAWLVAYMRRRRTA